MKKIWTYDPSFLIFMWSEQYYWSSKLFTFPGSPISSYFKEEEPFERPEKPTRKRNPQVTNVLLVTVPKFKSVTSLPMWLRTISCSN